MVLRGPIDLDGLRAAFTPREPVPEALAVCHVVDRAGGLARALEAQRRLTAALRETLGDRAEAIAVFVVTGDRGDTVEDLVRDWGATLVRDSIRDRRIDGGP